MARRLFHFLFGVGLTWLLFQADAAATLCMPARGMVLDDVVILVGGDLGLCHGVGAVDFVCVEDVDAAAATGSAEQNA